MRRVPDTVWEKCSDMVAAYDNLIGRGKEISKSIIATLARTKSIGGSAPDTTTYSRDSGH